MDCFERKKYESYFSKEAQDTVRWDKVDSEAIQGIFSEERLRLAAAGIVNYFGGTWRNDGRKKLCRYLYPAGNFEDMLMFLQCAVKGEGCGEMIMCLNRNFARDNGYNEPLWVIWGRFLTDVLDVLRQWIRCDDRAIERIINNF
jgi:hypothetical protein